MPQLLGLMNRWYRGSRRDLYTPITSPTASPILLLKVLAPPRNLGPGVSRSGRRANINRYRRPSIQDPLLDDTRSSGAERYSCTSVGGYPNRAKPAHSRYDALHPSSPWSPTSLCWSAISTPTRLGHLMLIQFGLKMCST
jgi:hypothetical protein